MASQGDRFDRRGFLGGSLKFSGAGLLAGLALEEQALLGRAGEPGTERPPDGPPASPIEGLPQGRLGKLKVSRLICGGNLFSGFAHSRQLIYVSRLLKEYFTPERILDTLALCEGNGINTAILRCDKHIIGILDRYRHQHGGKIQWIAQTYPAADGSIDNVRMAVDNGAVGTFMQGGIGDRFAGDGRLDLVEKSLEFVQGKGLAAGVGAHKIETVRAVEQKGLKPDFYFKTFNNVDYESEKPEQVAALMKDIARPWIAFKVLGAGAIHPGEGFRQAFSAGADFLNVGMFDFQVREDVAIARDLLARGVDRKRPWRS